MTKMGGKLKGKEKKANDYHKVLPGTRDKFLHRLHFQIKDKITKKMKKYVRNSALLVSIVALCAIPSNNKLIYKYLFGGKHCHCC